MYGYPKLAQAPSITQLCSETNTVERSLRKDAGLTISRRRHASHTASIVLAVVCAVNLLGGQGLSESFGLNARPFSSLRGHLPSLVAVAVREKLMRDKVLQKGFAATTKLDEEMARNGSCDTPQAQHNIARPGTRIRIVQLQPCDCTDHKSQLRPRGESATVRKEINTPTFCLHPENRL